MSDKIKILAIEKAEEELALAVFINAFQSLRDYPEGSEEHAIAVAFLLDETTCFHRALGYDLEFMLRILDRIEAGESLDICAPKPWAKNWRVRDLAEARQNRKQRLKEPEEPKHLEPMTAQDLAILEKQGWVREAETIGVAG